MSSCSRLWSARVPPHCSRRVVDEPEALIAGAPSAVVVDAGGSRGRL